MNDPVGQLTLTHHCLLRLVTTLSIEIRRPGDVLHSAAAELNSRTSQRRTPQQWLDILFPYYQEVFG